MGGNHPLPTGNVTEAYALYVLARNGRASIGDLRYIADERLDSLDTPLAKAQIGGALAPNGDRARAESVLSAAVAALPDQDPGGWRADYGSSLRDAAAVLALAAESGVKSVDLRSLADRVQDLASGRTYRSTQDNAWLLLAAQVLTKGGAGLRLSVDGTPHEGALFARFDGERLAAAPVTIRNLADSALDAMVTVVGVHQVPPPSGGNRYAIERAYYDLGGRRITLEGVPQGQRLLAVVTVRSDAKRQARLILDDPLPAGFEIANPSLLKSADIAQVPGLDLLDVPAHRELRTDRFVAAVDRGADDPETFQLGYLLRAVPPAASPSRRPPWRTCTTPPAGPGPTPAARACSDLSGRGEGHRGHRGQGDWNQGAAPSAGRTSLLGCKRASTRDSVREERESAKNANGVFPLHTLLNAWGDPSIRPEKSR